MPLEGFHFHLSSQPSLSSRMSDIGILFCTRAPSFSSSATTTESLSRLLISTITKQAAIYAFVYYNFFSAIDLLLFHCLENQISQEGSSKIVSTQDFKASLRLGNNINNATHTLDPHSLHRRASAD